MIKLLLFTQLFSIWFKVLLSELFNNFTSLFFIFSVYITLWHFPQTIDLLLILNQSETFLFEIPLYFSLLITSAFLIWNAPKYFYYPNFKSITITNLIGFIPNQHHQLQFKKKYKRYPDVVKVHMRKIIPRVLATILLIISSLSILNAMKLFELKNIYTDFINPTNTLIGSVLFLFLLTEPRIYKFFRKVLNTIPKTNFVILALVIGLILLIISLGTLNTQAEKDLSKLYLANSALVLLFIMLSFNSYYFLKKISNTYFYGIILVAGFILLLSFLILNFVPHLASKINPLSILMLSLISHFMISFILILLGKKLKLPFFTIACIFSFFTSQFFSNNSNHYQLNLKQTTVNRLPVEQYIYEWIKERQNIIENSKDVFPVILASSEGGGSRAGLWAFLVHSYLYEKSDGKYFKENLLSLSGASGGSVGNAMFFVEAQQAKLNTTKANFRINSHTKNHSGLTYKASAIYKENYLSEALLSLLGRDLFKEITGIFKFKNRGQLLEDHWSNSYQNIFSKNNSDNILDQEFLSFYKNVSYNSIADNEFNKLPLLFINTTHVQTGNYNIISPVKYSHLRSLNGMNDFLENLQYNYPNKSISLSTAMRINASFPYITPVGEIIKENKFGKLSFDQYTDAGYYDNIGGTVSKGIEEIFNKVLLDSFPSLKNKVELKHLLISNSVERKNIIRHAQLEAPLVTLQNVRHGHTQEIIQKLGNANIIKLKQTPIPPLKHKDSTDKKLLIKPVLPLGRYLSSIAIRSMEASLQEVKPQLDSIL